MTEKFAKIKGIKICYEVAGSGEPVILVHGFGSKKESWIATFPELLKYFKVIRFDNRGAGKTDRPETNYTMEVFADDIASLMDSLDIKKAHIIGWSLGGMIVQNFVLKYPEKVMKVVLINTNHGLPDENGPLMYKNMRLEEEKMKKIDHVKVWWDSSKTGFHRKFRKEMEANPSKKWYGLWSTEDMIEMSIIDPPTANDIEAQAEALKTHNTFKRLKNIKNPVLLLAASHDRITPRSSMEEMHKQISNSKFVVIEEAGHNSPLEKAPEVNKTIIEFLKN